MLIKFITRLIVLINRLIKLIVTAKWVIEQLLSIQSFNEQTAMINIYTFTFKNWNLKYILILKQP